MNENYPIDVLLTGSSRPFLLEETVKSFKENLRFRGSWRWIAHEDFVLDRESHLAWDYITNSGEFDGYDMHNPAIGLGKTLEFMLPKINTKYMFYLQDDWILERPVDLDQIIWVMEQHPEINCIFFNKIRNNGSINGAEQREYNFSGLRTCLYHSWTFLPGIWRTDWVRSKYRVREVRPEGYFSNLLGTHEQRMSVDYCYRNIGCFIYGHQGDYRYARHTGDDWRMAKWRLEGGKPSGVHSFKRMDEPYMAPWVDYKEMPTQFGDADGEESEKLKNWLSEEPPEVQEENKDLS